ncbi:MAG: transposase [Bryobacteraceae bacterium]|nr:transposase [Bryobacteraceae bacterium]
MPHGHVQAILGSIRRLGLDSLMASQRCQERDLALAMIAERLLYPCSKLATTRAWHTTTLAEELGVAECNEGDLYRAMTWLLARQARIEAKLAQRRLRDGAIVLYDVGSSYYEGRTCPLARFGHDRDGQKGRPIIVYGLLTDGEGCPVAIEAYPGNTGDPTTVPDQVEKLRQRFGLSRVVLVGDRGLLTETQIGKLREHPGLGWISALRGPAIRELVETGCLRYRGLARVERAFRCLKGIDLRIRPIPHRSADQVRAHILIARSPITSGRYSALRRREGLKARAGWRET